MKLPDSIKNLPISSIIVSILILSAIVYFLLLPALKQHKLILGRIKNKKADLGRVEVPTDKYAILRENLNNSKSQLAGLERRLFWEQDISKFLNELTRLASDIKIEFISLKPETAKPETASVPKAEAKATEKKELKLIQVPIAVAFRSNYNDMINFLRRIEEGGRFIKIDSLSIESEPNNIYKHISRMKLSIFVERGG